MDPGFPSILGSHTESSTIVLGEGDAAKFLTKPTANNKKMKTSQIKYLINELIACCLTHMQDSYRMHLSRLRGLKIIDTIVECCPIRKVDADIVTHMSWAIVSCLHHFFVSLKVEKGFMEWLRRRQAHKAVKTYYKLLFFLTPKHYDTVFNAIMTFLEEADLWSTEYFCAKLLKRCLFHADHEKRCNSILDIITLIENSTLTNVVSSRELLHVMKILGESVKWAWIDGRILTRLVEMYASSLVPEENHGLFEGLEKSLASCLQTMSLSLGEQYVQFMVGIMFKAILNERLSGEKLLHYGELLEYVHAVYTRKAAHHSLSDFTLPAIIKIMSSNTVIYSQLGLRFLHSFLDRSGNKWQFETPKIFRRDTKYNIIINEYRAAEKVTFQRYRERLHETLVKCVLTHGGHKAYVESLYICICLFLVEIPCAYTAAAGLCLVLTLQQLALSDQSLPAHQANRIHAIVVSVTTLICYIHKADILYDYTNMIVEKRASLAPHLNPPLKTNYSYAQHHILWDDPQFFFQDWEIRYGLWRCFRARYINVAVKKNDLMNMPLTNLDIVEL